MIHVKAAPGVRVPIEGKPKSYIEADVVEVEETAYYTRRIADGDLLVVKPVPSKKEVSNG
ncbi:MAG: DUF2635 domain-containing protein [Methylobacter tundripaludum]|nr:DUF2635 domain-containing protein [Methylobacter tundripaludum]